ncbi:MAG: hypothetical protein J4451_00995 [DPANN group archaeon]|jgi:hypothetical protein|nr:hypothetical protein [DPANN group archaeon]
MGAVAKLEEKRERKSWGVEECPSCNSTEISTNYFSGEMFCRKCGLVLY